MAEVTLPVVFAVAGVGCAIAAGTGGGFKLLVDIPVLRGITRAVVAVLACGFTFLAVWSYTRDDDGARPTGSALTPTATPASAPSNSQPGPPTRSAPVTPSPAPSSATPTTGFDGVLVVKYVDNTGYLDIDGHRTWGGDEDQTDDVDVAVTSVKVQAEGVARIALSESGGKTTCLAAIAREAPSEISMGQVQDDRGFCAMSRGGKVAYIRYMTLASKDGDHHLQFRLTVYR